MQLASRRVCGGCGAVVPAEAAFALWPTCPNAGDGGDHVLLRELDEEAMPYGVVGDPAYLERPFLRWRHRLHAWHLAQGAGWTDQRFITLVERLEAAIGQVDALPGAPPGNALGARRGEGFRVTPLVRADDLAALLSREAPLYVKDETSHVAGSHKARHLFGILLALEVLETPRQALLVIASCGNAALAAAVLAAAAQRPLRVFVPTDAEPAVMRRLAALGADIVVCERAPGVPGDPTVHRFREALAAGAIPFSCQGSDNGLAIEGGETLGWEIACQLAAMDNAPPTRPFRLFVQVGGGALGSAVARGLEQAHRVGLLASIPRIHAVQTTHVAPLARAYERLAGRLDRTLEALGPREPELAGDADRCARLAAATRRADRLLAAYPTVAFQAILQDAARHRADLMWAWEEPTHSAAHGILDDETYDWLALTRAMLASGGFPIVVDEAEVIAANALGVNATPSPVCETGSAGLAGLLDLALAHAIPSDEACLVLFSGARR